MADRWPVVITDDDGDTIEVAFGLTGVYIRTSEDGVLLSAAQRNEFDQVYAAASHEAERQPRPAPCGAVRSYGGPPCGQLGAHAEHIGRGPGGVIVATWPVSDGIPCCAEGACCCDRTGPAQGCGCTHGRVAGGTR